MEHTAGGGEEVTQQQKPCLGAQGMQSPRGPRREPPGVRVLGGAAQAKYKVEERAGQSGGCAHLPRQSAAQTQLGTWEVLKQHCPSELQRLALEAGDVIGSSPLPSLTTKERRGHAEVKMHNRTIT